MNKELAEAVKSFISQPLNNPLTRGQIMEVARIALPILEQQERGGSEWIEWGGGDCPVPTGTIVDVRYRSGQVKKSACAWGWGSCPGNSVLTSAAGAAFWRDDSFEDDIIAYRIIPEQPTNQNGEQ